MKLVMEDLEFCGLVQDKDTCLDPVSVTVKWRGEPGTSVIIVLEFFLTLYTN